MSNDMIECEDGEMRPTDECVETVNDGWQPRTDCTETADGDWHLTDECAETHDGRWYHTGDIVTLADGSVCHQDDDDYCCRHDGEYDWTDDCTMIDGTWYPDDECCRCSCCRCDMHQDDSYTDPNEDTICRSCYEDHCTSCDDCGDTIWSDDACHDDERDVYLCGGCYGDSRTRLILDYSDKSANKLRPESKDKLLFGVELEVESKSEANDGAEWVRTLMPDTYCVFKRDGSLGSGGFEIVTRPDSMAIHHAKWKPLLEASPGRRLRSWIGGRCGMHVHVTKSALSQLQLAKMLCFLNDPGNTAFVSTVAGRLPCHWCKVSPKKLSDVRRGGERYVALNITDKTAEFRIFRGTLLASSFYKNLEFVSALVAYCAPAQRSIVDATSFTKFCDWLDHKTYPNLHAYLVKRGYCKPPMRRAG